MNGHPRSRELPSAVRRFIEQRISSVEQLDILLFLYRDPARFWDAAGMAAALDLPESEVANHLEALGRSGLLDVRLASAMLYRFNPAPSSLRRDVREVAEAHRADRSQLLALLTPALRRD